MGADIKSRRTETKRNNTKEPHKREEPVEKGNMYLFWDEDRKGRIWGKGKGGRENKKGDGIFLKRRRRKAGDRYNSRNIPHRGNYQLLEEKRGIDALVIYCARSPKIPERIYILRITITWP